MPQRGPDWYISGVVGGISLVRNKEMRGVAAMFIDGVEFTLDYGEV